MFINYTETTIVRGLKDALSTNIAVEKEKSVATQECSENFDYAENTIDRILEHALIMLDCSYAKSPALFSQYPQITYFLDKSDFKIVDDQSGGMEYFFNISDKYKNPESLNEKTYKFLDYVAKDVLNQYVELMTSVGCSWDTCDDTFASALYEVFRETTLSNFSTKNWELINEHSSRMEFTPFNVEFFSEVSLFEKNQKRNLFEKIFDKSKSEDLSLEF